MSPRIDLKDPSPPAAELEPFEPIAQRLQASFAADPHHRSLPPQALTREALNDDRI